jgi:hypothetical protein
MPLISPWHTEAVLSLPWNIELGKMVGRCIRNRETNQWSPVSQMVWYPTSGEVLGRYHNGAVFKWDPYDQTHQEVFASATRIACSPEGTLFAIADSEGRIKLYNFYHFTVIYQLSYQEFCIHVAFSPDCRRIYDLRGRFCNVWEPNALIGLNDTEEREGEVGSELGSSQPASLVSEAYAETRDLITAICVCPGTQFCAAGNDMGLVQIFENGNLITEVWRSKNMSTAVHIDWAEDGEHFAVFELGGRVFIKRVKPPSKLNAEWSVEACLEVKVKVELGGVQQILLNHSSTHFLVASRTTANVWSCHLGEITTSRIFDAEIYPIRWMNHPTDSDLLLAFSLRHMTIYKWHDMSKIATIHYSYTPMATRIPGTENLVGLA